MPIENLQKLRAKYPQYDSIDDVTLAKQIIAKYPQYETAFGDIASGVPANNPDIKGGFDPNQRYGKLPYNPSLGEGELKTTPFVKAATQPFQTIAKAAGDESSLLGALDYLNPIPQLASIYQTAYSLPKAPDLATAASRVTGKMIPDIGMAAIGGMNPLAMGAFNAVMGVASDVAPNVTQFVEKPVSTIAKPETELGQNAAYGADILTNLGGMKAVGSVGKKLGTVRGNVGRGRQGLSNLVNLGDDRARVEPYIAKAANEMPNKLSGKYDVRKDMPMAEYKQAIEAMKKQQGTIWGDIQKSVDRQSHLMVDDNVAKQAVLSTIDADMARLNPEQARIAQEYADRFGGQRTLKQTWETIRNLNAELSKYYSKGEKNERAGYLASETERLIAQKEAARDALFDEAINRMAGGGEDVATLREMRRDWGAVDKFTQGLTDIKNKFGNRPNKSLIAKLPVIGTVVASPLFKAEQVGKYVAKTIAEGKADPNKALAETFNNYRNVELPTKKLVAPPVKKQPRMNIDYQQIGLSEAPTEGTSFDIRDFGRARNLLPEGQVRGKGFVASETGTMRKVPPQMTASEFTEALAKHRRVRQGRAGMAGNRVAGDYPQDLEGVSSAMQKKSYEGLPPIIGEVEQAITSGIIKPNDMLSQKPSGEILVNGMPLSEYKQKQAQYGTADRGTRAAMGLPFEYGNEPKAKLEIAPPTQRRTPDLSSVEISPKYDWKYFDESKPELQTVNKERFTGVEGKNPRAKYELNKIESIFKNSVRLNKPVNTSEIFNSKLQPIFNGDALATQYLQELLTSINAYNSKFGGKK